MDWFQNFFDTQNKKWLILGDFNLIRKVSDRNKPGADLPLMERFNEVISEAGLIEIPLFGRKYTWSNNQSPLLLERLDWFFTLVDWTEAYPNTLASSLVREPTDHNPCVIAIGTQLPKGISSALRIIGSCTMILKLLCSKLGGLAVIIRETGLSPLPVNSRSLEKLRKCGAQKNPL